jgi:hypothetical protein
MQKNNADETIGRFLFSALPDHTRLSYKLLAGLEFPLNDYASLKKQIGERQEEWDEDRRGAAERVLANLTPDDFPIITVQGALEKYHIRISFVDPSRFFRYGWALPRVEHEDILMDYIKLFPPSLGGGTQCYIVAYRAYLDALSSGIDEINAFYFGYRAGKSC